MGDQASERTAGRERDFTHGRALERRQAVVLGHPVVGIGEVGLHKVLRGKVVTDQAGEIGAGFFGHAVDEIIIETIFRVETNVGLIAAHVAQVQPAIRERTDKPLEARVGE